ncbi:MAG: hypothetical protein K0S33_2528 [Bacteroidetes bacterium]|jgi:CHAD domain-containing protein|nr:hypothetical protein [Bacteroidota bacterium]
MKKDILLYYIFERLQAVEEDLDAYKQKKDPERLHHLRVEMKKIRAAFTFAKEVYKQKTDLEPLKPLFRKAGAIRELLINTNMLGRWPEFPKRSIQKLKQKEKGLEQQFLKQIPAYSRKIKTFRASIDLPHELPDRKKIKKYFEKRIRKASGDLDTKERESLHELRKRIKVLMYNWHMLPGKIRKSLKVNEAFLDTLQQKAGEWHDTYAIVDFLSGMKLPAIRTRLEKLRRKEQQQFNSLVSAEYGKELFFQ